MGLDMYLTKRHYVKNWDFMNAEEKHKVTVKKNGKVRIDINPAKISGVTEDVMYWRKANEIHKWFVDNCRDGEDDCRDAYIDLSKLKELLNIINEVLRNKEKAPGLLPCQSGFFFGGTDYDEWYFQNLEETKVVLEKELAIENNYADYYYHSSW